MSTAIILQHPRSSFRPSGLLRPGVPESSNHGPMSRTTPAQNSFVQCVERDRGTPGQGPDYRRKFVGDTIRRTAGADRPEVPGGFGMRSLEKNFRLGAAALVVGAFGFIAPASADPVPPGWEASHMEPVGYTDVGGREGAFKMAIKKAADGRWDIYLGHLWHYCW